MRCRRDHSRVSKHPGPWRRRAVSLPEVLVVIGIFGLLVSLLLPAVQQARNSAHGTQCQNNLRQLLIATQAYESTHGTFPSTSTLFSVVQGSTVMWHYSHSPHGQLMPFLDPAIAKQIDYADATAPVWNAFPSTHAGSPVNQNLLRIRIPTLQCPMDNAPPGGTNYRANLGISCFIFASEPSAQQGAFVNGAALRPRDFTDGLSTTAMFSERLVGDGNPGTYTPFRDVFGVGVQQPTTAALLQICANSATLNPTDEYSFTGYSWMHGGWLHTWYTHISPPNARLPDCALGPVATDGGDSIYAARSFHRGGVHVATADGAVRFVADQIDMDTWTALGTRDGGETESVQ